MTVEITHEELKKYKDPWIEHYFAQLRKFARDMQSANLIHMAQSFGNPRTQGRDMYRQAATDYDVVTKNLILYLLFKGYITFDQMEHPWSEKPPKD